MKILVCADEKQEIEIRKAPIPAGAQVDVKPFGNVQDFITYDAIFFLDHFPDNKILDELSSKLIFINDVIHPISAEFAMRKIVRINGWPGFLQRLVWEGAGHVAGEASEAVSRLGRQLVKTADIPGLISGRIVASIINEAYSALKEDLSSKDEIDMAMKYGTNYPYGPFEWADKIGVQRVFSLLSRMAQNDDRYIPLFSASKTDE